MSMITRASHEYDLTVLNGATVSDAFDARPGAMYGLVIPSTFDGTTITFQVSADNSTYQSLYDTSNAQVSMTVAASRSYDLPTELAAWPFFKIVCGTSQTGSTVFTVVAKG